MRVSVVVPVYRGELTLEALIAEIVPLAEPTPTPAGTRFAVCEIVLVHDGAVDGSARVIKSLAAKHPMVLPLWLSRNFGQHAATLAGMASTTGDWVVTLDEDGQHNPREIAALLDAAIASGSISRGSPSRGKRVLRAAPGLERFRKASTRVRAAGMM